MNMPLPHPRLPLIAFVLAFISLATTAHGEQICKTDTIQASTPDSQFTDHGNGTVTDHRTGLMWKKCPEGLSGATCSEGSLALFNWQQALQRPGISNPALGHDDWRVPNVTELESLIEEQCMTPSINARMFPNTPSQRFWTSSPDSRDSTQAWDIKFDYGHTYGDNRQQRKPLRLVRDAR